MKHLGDIKKINGDYIEPVDVIVGGSPCQDLSIAGKREGLSGERSGLFMEQIRIIKEMRRSDEQRGRTGIMVRPRYMLWENVPGAFSSNNSQDFKAILEETAKTINKNAFVPEPPKGKWRNSGCIMGDGWSIAWRVLDAQFWGVPQRRRRIALVADFGGQSAPEILFERKSVCGNTQSGEAQGGKTSRIDEVGIEPTEHESVHQCFGFSGESGGTFNGLAFKEDVSPTLKAHQQSHVLCYDIGNSRFRNPTEFYDISPCLLQHSGSGGNNVPAVLYDCRGNGCGKISPTITGDHQNRVTDYTTICIQGNCIDRADTAGCNGMGWRENISYTLNTMDHHAICCFRSLDFGSYKASNIASTVLARDYKSAIDLVIASALDIPYNSKPSCFQRANKWTTLLSRYTIRRLTPIECERLQGYPDFWTDIPDYISTNGKRRKASDSARYKALGNSIALPQWKWILKRISAIYERDATLGSLFDGIGGFPLCWERINGKGSARWASEIEEFPIAVTNYHFG